MVKIQGAVIKEQGVTFAIVLVKRSVFNSRAGLNEAQNSFAEFFPGMPIVLMRQDSRGMPEYYGRDDIVRFLSNVHPNHIPWREYTFR